MKMITEQKAVSHVTRRRGYQEHQPTRYPDTPCTRSVLSILCCTIRGLSERSAKERAKGRGELARRCHLRVYRAEPATDQGRIHPPHRTDAASQRDLCGDRRSLR